jgi:hypothetical protein
MPRLHLQLAVETVADAPEACGQHLGEIRWHVDLIDRADRLAVAGGRADGGDGAHLSDHVRRRDVDVDGGAACDPGRQGKEGERPSDYSASLTPVGVAMQRTTSPAIRTPA